MLPFVLFPLFALLSLVLFVLLLLVLFAVMFLLVLSPWRVDILQLYQITDMNYKLLLVELAISNFLICFLLEVRKPTKNTPVILYALFLL